MKSSQKSLVGVYVYLIEVQLLMILVINVTNDIKHHWLYICGQFFIPSSLCTAQTHPRHCNDYLSVHKPVTSGIRLIKPDDDGDPFYVYCNMEHYGGGWTRIQRRSTSKISFRRDWDTYREGFGYLSGDGWLGLEKIHRLTKNNAQLLITVRDKSYNYYYAQYRKFMVGSEDTEYTLYIGNYTGDAGDSLSYSNYAKFSTYDEDNDLVSSSNCASSYRGGWWYKGSNCFQGKLNGDAYSSSTSYSTSSSRYYVVWPGASSTALYSVTMEIKISPH